MKKSSRYASGTARESNDHELLDPTCRENESRLTGLLSQNTRNVCLEAKENRRKYLEYFNGEGRVDFQDEMIQKGRA